jgi:hypothetical protein
MTWVESARWLMVTLIDMNFLKAILQLLENRRIDMKLVARCMNMNK